MWGGSRISGLCTWTRKGGNSIKGFNIKLVLSVHESRFHDRISNNGNGTTQTSKIWMMIIFLTQLPFSELNALLKRPHSRSISLRWGFPRDVLRYNILIFAVTISLLKLRKNGRRKWTRQGRKLLIYFYDISDNVVGGSTWPTRRMSFSSPQS